MTMTMRSTHFGMVAGAVTTAFVMLANPLMARDDAVEVQDPGLEPARSQAFAATKPDAATGPEGAALEVLETGHRREQVTLRIPVSDERIREIRDHGKAIPVDRAAREIVLETFRDHLPAGWQLDSAGDGLADSFGNPIVNRAPGLPDWAERDVQALRAAIAATHVRLRDLDLGAAGGDDVATERLETAAALGNYVGQAIVRAVGIADLVNAATGLDQDTIAAAGHYLAFYESLKRGHAARTGERYERSTYPDDVAAMLQQIGWTVDDATDPEGPSPVEGVGGCYLNFTFGLGWTLLSGDTTLWNGAAGTYDDVSADVPIGFRAYLYPCENPNPNTSVRVSTNGYFTFYEQGGGSLDGVDWTNDPLPSATDPDGMAAGWWDDLIVQNQGSVDRVSYKTEGSTGNRVFTVQYFSISRLGGDTDDFQRFQIKLFEQSGQIQFHYDTLWQSDSINNATTGIENFNGTTADCANFNCTNTRVTPTTNVDFFYPQPSNDACGNAICIDPGQPVSGTTFGATGTDLTSCATNDFADVWYSYTAPASGTAVATLCGSGYDTTLAAFASCGGAELACNDDFCGLQSEISFPVTAGTPYLIRVSGWSSHRGDFDLVVTSTNSLGDGCDDCWTLGTGFIGFTTNNAGCLDDSSCAFGDVIDEWFCWTPPRTGTVYATTCHSSTNFDTTLAVYSDCPTNGGVELACNDDWVAGQCQFPNGLNRKSRVEWLALAGTTYRIRVSGFAGDVGTYHLSAHWCVPDVNGDGQVGVDDMLEVLSLWGACPPAGECPADINGDGVVNVDDLLPILSEWGPC